MAQTSARKNPPPKLPPKLQSPPQPLGPRDPAELLRNVLAALARDGARALAAAEAGDMGQALRAALDMQRVFKGADEVLKQAAYAGRSKRAPLEMRRRVGEAFRQGMAPVADAVRRLGVRLKAAKARQAALSAALAAAASRPASVYVARGYSKQGRAGAVRPVETVRHALALTV